jgi:hypothetical protein
MNGIFMCFSVPYTSCHSSQPKRPKEIREIRVFGGGKKEMMEVGPNSFDTNKQTKFYQLLTYLLQSTYSRVLNFIITLKTPNS